MTWTASENKEMSNKGTFLIVKGAVCKIESEYEANLHSTGGSVSPEWLTAVTILPDGSWLFGAVIIGAVALATILTAYIDCLLPLGFASGTLELEWIMLHNWVNRLEAKSYIWPTVKDWPLGYNDKYTVNVCFIICLKKTNLSSLFTQSSYTLKEKWGQLMSVHKEAMGWTYLSFVDSDCGSQTSFLHHAAQPLPCDFCAHREYGGLEKM